jgi:hypothetical protein
VRVKNNFVALDMFRVTIPAPDRCELAVNGSLKPWFAEVYSHKENPQRFGMPFMTNQKKLNLWISQCFFMLLVFTVATAQSWAGSIDVAFGPDGTLIVLSKNGTASAKLLHVPDLEIGSNLVPVLLGRSHFSLGHETAHQGADYWFGSGGSLVVTGCAVLDPKHSRNCDKKDFHGILITAKFLSAEIVEKAGKFFLEAEVLEQINPTLARLLKLTKDDYFAQLNLSLDEIASTRWQTGFSVLSGSFFTLPEPSSFLLLLLGLASVALCKQRAERV